MNPKKHPTSTRLSIPQAAPDFSPDERRAKQESRGGAPDLLPDSPEHPTYTPIEGVRGSGGRVVVGNDPLCSAPGTVAGSSRGDSTAPRLGRLLTLRSVPQRRARREPLTLWLAAAGWTQEHDALGPLWRDPYDAEGCSLLDAINREATRQTQKALTARGWRLSEGTSDARGTWCTATLVTLDGRRHVTPKRALKLEALTEHQGVVELHVAASGGPPDG